MKAIEVYVNGRYLLTAGFGKGGVLTGLVTCVSLSPPRHTGGRFHFDVDGVDGETHESVSWSVPRVGVGDEITIKLVEADQASPAHRRPTVSPIRPGETFKEAAHRLISEGWPDGDDEPGP